MQQTSEQNTLFKNNEKDFIIVYNQKEVDYLRKQKGGKYKQCYAYCQQCNSKYPTIINRLYLTGFICKKCKISNTKKNASKEFKEEIQKKRKQTCLEKYGVDNVFKAEEIKEKSKETLVEKYGVTNAQQLQVQKDYIPKRLQIKEEKLVPKVDEKKHLKKLEKLKLTKWDTRSNEERKQIIEKTNNTFFKKYGKTFKEYFIEKSRQTCLEKYGVDNPWKSDTIKERIKQTNIQRYGGPAPTCSEAVQEKRMKTYRKNGIHRFKPNHYFYENTAFDSSWELAVWIWAKDNHFKIEREPLILTYKARNRTRHYLPDFKINEKLVEVKGDQFFDRDGNLINLFARNYDDIAREKQKCMIMNNVEIWRNAQIHPILDYIAQKYSVDYLEQFRIKK